MSGNPDNPAANPHTCLCRAVGSSWSIIGPLTAHL